jgi:hypothetical protein
MKALEKLGAFLFASYTFANLDILALHTKQEPWILGLLFFIHTRVGFFISRLALHLKQQASTAHLPRRSFQHSPVQTQTYSLRHSLRHQATRCGGAIARAGSRACCSKICILSIS